MQRPLHNLLDLVTSCDSHDPCDKTYGVLGLATDPNDSDLEVDYAKAPVEIGVNIAGHSIRQRRGYRMLYSVCCPAERNEEWPSWLRDRLTNKDYIYPCGKRIRSDIPNHHIQTFLPAIRLESTFGLLSVKGFFLDVTEELGMERESRRSSPNCSHVLQQMEAIVAKSQVLRASQKQPDSLWRTTIANSTLWDDSIAPPELGTKYQHFQEIVFESENPPKNDDYDAKESTLIKPRRKYEDHEDFLIAWEKADDARFCTTRSGMMARVSKTAEVGDIIFTVLGDPDHRTFVVRIMAHGNYYTWIGRSYVHCAFGDEYREIEEGETCEIHVR